MAWARLQSFNGLGSTSCTATPGSNLTSGSVMIAVVAVNSNTGSTPSITVKDASANSFLQVAAAPAVAYSNGSVFLFCISTPAGDAGAKPVITATDSLADEISLLVVEFSGLATGGTLGSMVDGTAGTSSGSAASPTTSPSYSSSLASELLISCVGDTGGYTWTKPAALAADPNNQNGTSNGDASLAYGNSTGTSESAVWTFTGSGSQWASILVAFKLSGPVITSGPLLGLQALVQAPVTVPSVSGWRNAAHSR